MLASRLSYQLNGNPLLLHYKFCVNYLDTQLTNVGPIRSFSEKGVNCTFRSINRQNRMRFKK